MWYFHITWLPCENGESGWKLLRQILKVSWGFEKFKRLVCIFLWRVQEGVDVDDSCCLVMARFIWYLTITDHKSKPFSKGNLSNAFTSNATTPLHSSYTLLFPTSMPPGNESFPSHTGNRRHRFPISRFQWRSHSIAYTPQKTASFRSIRFSVSHAVIQQNQFINLIGRET